MPRIRPLLALSLALAVAGPATAVERDYACNPSAVKVDYQKIEIVCTEAIVLSERAQDRFREIDRFAFPMISQNFQPLLGRQGELLDYFLEVAQNAVIHERTLHIWFDDDFGKGASYGCEPTNCREITALALTRERPRSGQ